MSARGVASPWRALRHRNYKLFFVGQSISVIGTWMTRVATSWLVYRLTGSALLLGAVGFVSQIIPFLLQPVAGVWVERLDRRRLLVWTQVVAGLQSLALATLTLTHVITLWEIVALNALQGLINAFDAPGRHAFLVQMVEDRHDLGNGIALNSSMVNGARLIGPALAGVVIGAVGEGWCFLIDGVSYLAVILSLLLMRMRPLDPPRARGTVLDEMREGWDYVRSFHPIRTILVVFSLACLMGYSYTVLLPLFAGHELNGGPHTLGWLTSASGAGALLGALSLAMRRSADGLPRMVAIAVAVLGVALVLFGGSHTLWWSLVLMLFAGFGMMHCASATNTIIQSLAPEDKRARVVSYWAMAVFGSAPLGSLLAGVLAHRIGAPRTLMVTGASCIATALWFSFELPRIERETRPFYQRFEEETP
jgi:MFS family permease